MFTRFWNLTNLAWATLYLVLMALLVWQMFALKERMVTQLGTPSAQADWDQFKEASAKPGPVERRVSKSAEPPTLVLLRDYFGVCLACSIFFSSILYFVFMVFLRGAFGKPPSRAEPR